MMITLPFFNMIPPIKVLKFKCRISDILKILFEFFNLSSGAQDIEYRYPSRIGYVKLQFLNVRYPIRQLVSDRISDFAHPNCGQLTIPPPPSRTQLSILGGWKEEFRGIISTEQHHEFDRYTQMCSGKA